MRKTLSGSSRIRYRKDFEAHCFRFTKCWPRLALAGLLLLSTSGCVMPMPIMDEYAVQSFREHPMRRMETDHLLLYYPEHRAEDAGALAAQIEECLRQIEDLLPEDAPRSKELVKVVFPEYEFNNAYVALPMLGIDPLMLVPTHFTADFFGEVGISPSPSVVACHEAIHYVHALRIRGIPRIVRFIVGNLYTPQAGLDGWFWEGLAVYYESKLIPGIGRMASPLWRQTFASGVAEESFHGGSWLHMSNRSIQYNGIYLTGSHFVEYLAETHGEDKLWEVVERQASALVFPAFVNRRFKKVYGKSLSRLVREFSKHVEENYPLRSRPEDQIMLHKVARNANFEVSREGSYLLFGQELDRAARFTVYGPDGEPRFERELPDLLPPRQIRAGWLGRWSFSPDGQRLFVTSLDYGRSQILRTNLLEIDIDEGEVRLIHEDLGGSSGDITPDGKKYVFPLADGNRHHLAVLDMETSNISVIHRSIAEEYVVSPRVSPNGQNIAAIVWRDHRTSVCIFDIEGNKLRTLTGIEGSYQDPYWLDDMTLLYLSEVDGRFQAVAHRLEGDEAMSLTDAPYVVRAARPAGNGRLRFLNLEGWTWTLDEIVLPGALTETMQSDIGETDTVASLAHSNSARDLVEELQEIEPLPLPEVRSDRPYSRFDGLFFPRLRLPNLKYGPTTGWSAYLGLSGSDRLGFHNWAVEATYHPQPDLWDFSLQYIDMQLAPWVIFGFLWQDWAHISHPAVFVNEEWCGSEAKVRLRDASVGMLRSFYDIDLGLFLTGNELLFEDGDSRWMRRFVGGYTTSGFATGRFTSYSGPRSLLATSLSLGGYSAAAGSDFNLLDLRAAVATGFPLPFSRRHTFNLIGRGRLLVHGSDDDDLLILGGFPTGGHFPLFSSGSSGNRSETPADVLIPHFVSFSESLRGYEDRGFVENGALIFDATYRYPLIIDRGTVSSLYFLPPFFVKEASLELFGAYAFTSSARIHAAVGGSLALYLVFGRVPFGLGYQVAQRLVDDEAFVQSFFVDLGAF